ncbi:MAG: N-acylglucosamine 2-epimerase [Phycisphaerae bacterium]
MNLNRLHELYRTTLLDEVVPFWERHALDPTGAINNCIRDDGSLVSRDRWGWSQWRAVWVFSALYNRISPRPGWLRIARGVCDWLRSRGPLPGGHWPLLMDEHGSVRRGYECIFTDAFAIYGLVELWRATQDDHLLNLALDTFRAAQAALQEPVLPPMAVYPPAPSPSARAHGLSMMYSLVAHELAQATGAAEVRAAADHHHRLVMDTFLRVDRGLLLEWIDDQGNELPAPGGTAVLPGHAIESFWFQIHIARDKQDRRTIDRALQAIRRHLEIGWDEEFGGVFYAVDAERRPEVGWPFAEYKLWWVHSEILYATLLAHELCGEPWCLDWHERIRQYAFAHYPVPGHGEWTQRLDRQGRPVETVVALPVKDPFHLPRALIYCLEALERLGAAG